jgi:hypothetical protein
MSRHPLIAQTCRTTLACLALAAPALTGRATFGQDLHLVDVAVIEDLRVGGEKFGEFSALVADPDGAGVIAVSDRGYLAGIGVATDGGQLSLTLPDIVHVLTGPDGQPLRDAEFNPEGAALLADGTIAIVSEAGPTLAVFDRTGAWLRTEALPLGLQDATRQSSPKDGIEALAWTKATGFLAMLEEPALGDPRNAHRLHTTQAGVAALNLPGSESISIKGMEIADGALLILERTRDDTTDALYPYLRRVDVAACLATAACTGTASPIPEAGISDADFEGLAPLPDGHLLIVSDDKIDGRIRSVFALLRLE